MPRPEGPLTFVASDLDGTFVADTAEGGVEPTQANIAAWQRLDAMGIPVAVCTGRSAVSAGLIMDLTGVDGYVISIQGAMVQGPRNGAGERPLLSTIPVPAGVVERSLAHAEAEGTAVSLYTARGILNGGTYDFGANTTHGQTSIASWFVAVGEPLGWHQGDDVYEMLTDAEKAVVDANPMKPHSRRFRTVAELRAHVASTGEDILKCVVLAPPGKEDAPLARLREQCDESECHTMGPFDGYYEITKAHCNKARALRTLMASLGRTIDDVLAFGDSHNDYEMLRDAGLGVAMANAVPACKGVASHVSPHTNAESAVAREIERLLQSGCLVPESK